LISLELPRLIGSSKLPSSSTKEQRYRENLETDILNNSAALIRWQRVEIEVRSSHYGNPYSPHRPASTSPSKELEWLSNLVPYKLTLPHTRIAASPFLPLPPIPETPDHLDKHTQVQIHKTVDVLLDEWTTLRRNPQNSAHNLPPSNHKPKSKPRRQHMTTKSEIDRAESEQAQPGTPQPRATGLATAAPKVPGNQADPGTSNGQPFPSAWKRI
jgi:hypothetical protein